MERGDFRTFLALVCVVVVTMGCCCGLITLNKSCEARGGHFEGYWGGRGMVCVGGDK